MDPGRAPSSDARMKLNIVSVIEHKRAGGQRVELKGSCSHWTTGTSRTSALAGPTSAAPSLDCARSSSAAHSQAGRRSCRARPSHEAQSLLEHRGLSGGTCFNGDGGRVGHTGHGGAPSLHCPTSMLASEAGARSVHPILGPLWRRKFTSEAWERADLRAHGFLGKSSRISNGYVTQIGCGGGGLHRADRTPVCNYTHSRVFVQERRWEKRCHFVAN
jgi:hypothetical protein